MHEIFFFSNAKFVFQASGSGSFAQKVETAQKTPKMHKKGFLL